MMRCNTSAHCASPSVHFPTVLVPATWRKNATMTTKLRVACATSAKRASPPAWLSLLCSVLVFPHPVMHGDSGACQMRDAARQDLPDTRCCERGLVYHIPGPKTATKAAGARPARAQVDLRTLWKCWPEPAQRHVRRSGQCRWRATTTRNRVRLARATDENGASHGHPTASRERSGVYWKESMGAAAGRADPRPPTASKACHESEFGAAGGCTRGPGRLVCLCVPVCLCVFPVCLCVPLCPHTSPCVHVVRRCSFSFSFSFSFFLSFLSFSLSPPSPKNPLCLSHARTHAHTGASDSTTAGKSTAHPTPKLRRRHTRAHVPQIGARDAVTGHS